MAVVLRELARAYNYLNEDIAGKYFVIITVYYRI